MTGAELAKLAVALADEAGVTHPCRVQTVPRFLPDGSTVTWGVTAHRGDGSQLGEASVLIWLGDKPAAILGAVLLRAVLDAARAAGMATE